MSDLIIQKDKIKLIKDAETLGIYIYSNLLCGEKFIFLPTLFEQVIEELSNHFNLSERHILRHIKELEKLGLCNK